jgi:hypothetical protein
MKKTNTKFNDKFVRQIEELKILGLSDVKTCEAVGLSRETYYNWKEKQPYTIYTCGCKIKIGEETIVEEGKKDEIKPIYDLRVWEYLDKLPPKNICSKCKQELQEKPSFADRVDKAKAIGQKNLLKQIHGAIPKDWKAAAWLLERTDPDEYAKLEKRHMSGSVGNEATTFADGVKQVRDQLKSDPEEEARLLGEVVDE